MLDVAENVREDQTLTIASTPPTQAACIEAIDQDGILDCTAKEANIILRDCHYEKQNRHMSPSGKRHIQVLADLIRRRQWRKGEKLDFARVNGKLFLINGYHRLSAQALAGVSLRWLIVVHDCANMAAVADLFYTFDTNIKPRSTAQILDVMDFSTTLGVSKGLSTAVYKAMPLILADFDFNRLAVNPIVYAATDLRMQAAASYQDAILLYDKAVEKAPTHVKNRLFTAGALAPALACFKYQPKKAMAFWEGVALNDGLSRGDPRHTYLAVIQAGGTTGSSRAPAALAAGAWNAWFRDKTLTLIRSATTFYLYGTPFKGQ